jgi:hypothetical protein
MRADAMVLAASHDHSEPCGLVSASIDDCECLIGHKPQAIPTWNPSTPFSTRRHSRSEIHDPNRRGASCRECMDPQARLHKEHKETVCISAHGSHCEITPRSGFSA